MKKKSTNCQGSILKNVHVGGQKPKASRRSFIRKSLYAASAILVSRAPKGCTKDSVQGSVSDDIFACIDYGNSFYCNTAKFNSVRMWIESRTTIIDTKSGISTVYYQGASCKSEDTFAEKDLFLRDNYDFLPIFGGGKVLVFRRYNNKRGEGSHPYRTIRKMEEMWGDNPVIYSPAPKIVTELDTWEKIRDATAAGIPIVTQTKLKNSDTGLTAIIECPCKTMNISHPKKMYQVDTGPVALPDLSMNYEIQIDCLSLAFIAFNKPHFADFVIESPTPIIEGGNDVATVYHYSKIVSMTAENTIFALGKI